MTSRASPILLFGVGSTRRLCLTAAVVGPLCCREPIRWRRCALRHESSVALAVCCCAFRIGELCVAGSHLLLHRKE